MVVDLLESLKIYRNGEWDLGRATIIGVLAGGFVFWRVFAAGDFGADGLKRTIKRELADDYRQAVYEQHGMYDEDAGSRLPSAAASAELTEAITDITVRFDDFDVAAPLLSFSSLEEVVVRFDYSLSAGGIVRERGKSVYKRLKRAGNTAVFDSGPVSYYVKFFL